MMNYDSKAFCALPFIHKHKNLSGIDNLCCMSQKPVTDQEVKVIRQKIIDGEKIEHCNVCYTHEDAGVISSRIRENERWLSDTEVKAYLDSYTIDGEEKTFSYDLRYSNTCNLACVACGPGQSSLWAKELKWEIKPTNFKFDITSAKHAKWIYLAGGEPFLTEDLVKLLREIAKKDDQPFICINTNLTVQDDDVKEMCRDLKSLTLQISIDGVDKVAEYHRYPLKWEKFQRNLEWARSLDCDIMFNTVVDAINVSAIHDIMEYEDIPRIWNLTLLQNPKALRVENLPEHLKQQAHDNFIKLRESKHYHSDSNFKTNVDNIASNIFETGTPEKLAQYVSVLDSRRNINHVEMLGIKLNPN